MRLQKLILLLALVELVSGLKGEQPTIINLTKTFEEASTKMFLAIFGIIFCAGVLHLLCKLLPSYIPVYGIFLLFMILLGVWAHYNRDVHVYFKYLTEIKTETLLLAYLPIIIFKTIICIDIYSFFKALPQTLIICIPILFLSAMLNGFLLSFFVFHKFDFFKCLMFGFICCPICPTEVLVYLKTVGAGTKHVIILLEGERIIGIAVVLIMSSYLDPRIPGTALKVLKMVSLDFVAAPLFGLACGYVGCLLMRQMYTDPVNLLIMTTTLPLVVALVVIKFIGASTSVISVVIVGICMAFEKISAPNKMEELLMDYWAVMGFVINSIFYVAFCISFGSLELISYPAAAFTYVWITYLITNVGRLVSFLLFAPLLSRFGYGITWQEMVLCVWAGLKHPISLCIAVDWEVNFAENSDPRITYLHIFSLFIFTILVNGSTIPALTRALGLTQISPIKQINMNNCMKYVLHKRTQSIAILKMDRFLSDANWPLVNKATTLKHPYEDYITHSLEDDELFLGTRFTTCGDCKKEIPYEPSPRQLKEMMREARLRILKAKKISYARQFENGMMSKKAIRTLTQTVEVAMDSEDALIELEGLHVLFQKKDLFNRFCRKRIDRCFRESKESKKIPRRHYRRFCYELVNNPLFFFFICLTILCNLVLVLFSIFYRVNLDDIMWVGITLIFTTFFFTIYLMEFMAMILAYSWIFIWKHGVKGYFRSFWNNLDFFVLVTALLDLITQVALVCYKPLRVRCFMIALQVLQMLRILRLVRIIRYCVICYSRVGNFWDTRLDKNVAYAYDVGKGYVEGEEEVLLLLPHMIDHEGIRSEMKHKMEEDRLEVTKLLAIVQKDKPAIAISVKTKQALRTVLNYMKAAALELKMSGWLDDFEFDQIKETLYDRYRFVSRIGSIPDLPPKILFREVSWMTNDEVVVNYLYRNVKTRKFDPGDQICVEGQLSEGIYIVVWGLFLSTYIPRSNVLFALNEYGALPVVDHMVSSKFDEPLADFVMVGNCIGELSTLTSRPYSATIIADTYCQAYVITPEIMKGAMALSDDPINGLECRLWKAVSVPIATAILLEQPAYQSSTLDKIRFALERAFMPRLTNFKYFFLNDLVQDVILIEGLAVDFNTRDIFGGPCYIPRTVAKVILSKSSLITTQVDVETRLLIIPSKESSEYGIKDLGDYKCELVAKSGLKCIQHSIQVMQRRKPRKRIGIMEIGPTKISDKNQMGSNTTINTIISMKTSKTDSKDSKSSRDSRGSNTNVPRFGVLRR